MTLRQTQDSTFCWVLGGLGLDQPRVGGTAGRSPTAVALSVGGPTHSLLVQHVPGR